MGITSPWQPAFDLIGLATYYTLMTGELPDERMMAAARERQTVREITLPEASIPRTKSATKKIAQRAA